MNKCCPECFRLIDRASGEILCSNPSCYCHPGKGEKQHTEVCSFKSPTAPCSCPTQPESNWEDVLFDLAEKYCDHEKLNGNCLYHIFRPFIEREIEAAEERGKAANEAYEKGRLDVIAELINKVRDIKITTVYSTDEADAAHCKSMDTVLDLLTVMRKEIGMRNLGGDAPCADCQSQTNPVWFTDNVFWNFIMSKEKYKILCLYCFIIRAENKTAPTGWHIAPEWPYKEIKSK